MDTLVRELQTLLENDTYKDNFDFILQIISKINKDYPNNYSDVQLINDLKIANLAFFAKKVESNYYKMLDNVNRG